VTVIAHIGGLPLEEILPTLAGASSALLLARGWLALHLRRARNAAVVTRSGKRRRS
jgi:hypothetical protein